MKRIFLNTAGKVRNAWWVGTFFMILAAFVFPMILLSQAYRFEITYWHQVIVIALASIIAQKLSGNRLSSLYGSFHGFGQRLLIGVCTGSLLMLIPALIFTLLGWAHWEVSEVGMRELFSAVWLMTGVVVAEELLFRGFIFQRLIAGLGEWPAQIIVALLFLLTHSANLGIHGFTKIFAIVNIFTASILMGMAYLKTRSLVLPVSIHFAANIMQGSILGFSVSGNEEVSILSPRLLGKYELFTGGKFGIEAGLVGLLILFLTTAWVYLKFDKLVLTSTTKPDYESSRLR